MTEEPLADARDMLAVHTMFRRELGLLPGLVRGVVAGDAERAAVVGDHVALVTRMLHIHHSGEDKHIWPLLRERGAREITQIVDVMQEQHERIHQDYLQADEALAAWREHAPAGGGDALAGAIEQLIPHLEAHLSLEEDRVVPLIERYVTAAEYARLAGEGAQDTPPELLPACLGMVMHDAEPAVIEMIVAELPAEVRPAFPRAANEAYAAYARRLHGLSPAPKLADSR
jgi:hemerythrin-like domain-containing protein